MAVSAGHLASVLDPRRLAAVSYAYDGNDRCLSRTDQTRTCYDGYTSYNGSGEPGTWTDRKGQATGYTYDDLGRLTRTTYNDGSYVQTTWDAGNRPGNPSMFADRPEESDLQSWCFSDLSGAEPASMKHRQREATRPPVSSPALLLGLLAVSLSQKDLQPALQLDSPQGLASTR